MQSSWLSAEQMAQLSNDNERAFLSPLPFFSLVRIQGDDQRRYLQGQVTSDVLALTDSQWQRGAHCDAKGKMWGSFYLYTEVDQPALNWLGFRDEVQASLTQLKKYGVFAKVQFEELLEHAVFGVGGEDAVEVLTALALPIPAIGERAQLQQTAILALAADHFMVITDKATAHQWLERRELLAAPTRWLAQHIAHGIPFVEHALQNEYVPQQLNLQALDAISFSKGCYMGQEMVARMKYLGKNKRAMYLLQGAAQGTPAAGDDIELQLEHHWRRAGVVVNAVNIQGQLSLLAVLPNDITPESGLRLAADPEVLLSIQPLPYSLD